MVATSFQQSNYSRQRLFTKQKTWAAPFIGLVFLSIVLMVLDARELYLFHLRWGLSVVTAPIQYTVDYPQRVFRWVQSLVSSKTALIQENMQLHYQQTLLEARLQHFLALKAENSQLKALLRTTSDVNTKAVAAQILDVDMGSTRQLLVLDKGKRDGILIGQAVLDAKGVMGQVIDVGFRTSTVLLISDSKSAVPVRNHRTGEWAILMGANKTNELVLLNLPKTSPIQNGDLLVTSGLGGHYPEGYPIGTVKHLKQIVGEPFIHVDVLPIAKLNQSHLVLVLLGSPEQTALIKQIHARLNALGVPI